MKTQLLVRSGSGRSRLGLLLMGVLVLLLVAGCSDMEQSSVLSEQLSSATETSGRAGAGANAATPSTSVTMKSEQKVTSEGTPMVSSSNSATIIVDPTPAPETKDEPAAETTPASEGTSPMPLAPAVEEAMKQVPGGVGALGQLKEAVEQGSQNLSGGGSLSLVVKSDGDGAKATASVKTSPNASCSIEVQAPDGSLIFGPELDAKSADENGDVSWTWRIGKSGGTSTVTVTCDGSKMTSRISIG